MSRIRIKPLRGKTGTKATKSVAANDPKYTVVAIRRHSCHIFRSCVFGPLKKKLPIKAMILPTVALRTKGIGFPSSKSLILQKEPKDKRYPATMQVPKPKSRSRQVISGKKLQTSSGCSFSIDTVVSAAVDDPRTADGKRLR